MKTSKLFGLLLCSVMLLSQAVGYASGCIHAPPKKAKVHDQGVQQKHNFRVASEQTFNVAVHYDFSQAHCDVYVGEIEYAVTYIKNVKPQIRIEKTKSYSANLERPPDVKSKGLVRVRTFDC